MQKKILVALHKSYPTPPQELYLPVQAGAAVGEDFGVQRDDIGDNISALNPYFCELTALYWAWKNLDCVYIGLVHYRRYFVGKLKFCINGNCISVLSQKEADRLLSRTDVILPKKRNYYIETLYSHYAHTMYVEPLDEAGRIIDEIYPAYSKEFARLKKRRSAHMFNMLVMKKSVLNEYCTWLFDILFKLKDRIDVSQYDDFHARFFGRVSELLLDVWINTNRIKYCEVKMHYTEHVNWLQKGARFLKAKFGHKKYEVSDNR